MPNRRVAAVAAMFLTLSLAVPATARAGEPPRAARSVHLSYPAPNAVVFYNEMAVEQSTPGSYFMAAGWNPGYFGIQELDDGRKVIIFSVWDPTAGDDPSVVKSEDRVECLHQAPDVRIRRFGGEGTGGQCMGKFDWQIGSTYRFVVTGTVEGPKTAYGGYVWLEASKEWKHLVTFRTRSGGRPLKGLYSFIEDFRRDGKSVHDVRRARFGNGWVKTGEGQWQPLNRARFTASGAEWESKDNINAGLDKGLFFLATGGDTKNTLPLKSLLEKPATDAKPPQTPE